MYRSVLFVLISLCVVTGISLFADNVVFLDANFKAHCVAKYDTDGDLEISTVEAAAVTGNMYCPRRNIADLTGIEAFSNLQGLACQDNQLTSLPDLPSYLWYVECQNNQLTSLPDFSNLSDLMGLYCYDNRLTSLPNLSSNTVLRDLYCYNNQLTSLPDLPLSLQKLYCYHNQLIILPDLSNLTSLEKLYCNSNKLTSLPDLPSSLEWLNCWANHLDESSCDQLDGFSSLNYEQGNPLYQDWPQEDWLLDKTKLISQGFLFGAYVLDCGQAKN